MNNPGPYGPAFTRLCRALGDLSDLEAYARKQEALKPSFRRQFWDGVKRGGLKVKTGEAVRKR